MLASHQGPILSPLSPFQGIDPEAARSAALRSLLQRDANLVLADTVRGGSGEDSAGEDKDYQGGDEDQEGTTGGTVPSERVHLNLPEKCATHNDSIKVLSALGSTLRSKSDPYIDASKIEVDTKHAPAVARRGVIEIFPDKLYKMLRDVEDGGLTDIVSFVSHGRAFRVHKVDAFVKKLMPEYFPSLGKWSRYVKAVDNKLGWRELLLSMFYSLL
jgi:hypothetical protein